MPTKEENRDRQRKWRAANPIKAIYNNKKARAKQRGISFTMSFEEFEAFCLETGYHEMTGRDAGCASLDRLKEDRNIGYTAYNIGIKTVSGNQLKELSRRYTKPWYSIESDQPYRTEDPF